MELLKCEVTNAGTAQDMMPPPSSGVLPLHSRNTTQTWRPQLKTASVTGSNSMKRKPRTVTWCVLERKTSTPRVLSQTQAKHQSGTQQKAAGLCVSSITALVSSFFLPSAPKPLIIYSPSLTPIVLLTFLFTSCC